MVGRAQQPASPSPSNPFTRGFPAPAAALIAAAPPQPEGPAAGAPAASVASPALSAPMPESSAAPGSSVSAPAATQPAGAAGGPSDPCACTATGVSGGANTSAPGCGQHLLTFGSNDFVCFINDPVNCNTSTRLTNDSRFPGAAYKTCSPGAEGTQLPTLRTLLRTNNRIYLFYTYLRESNLTSVQAQNITVFAPENQGFTAAIADGSLEQGDLSSPDFVRQLVLDSIVPEALTLDQLKTMDYVETAGGTDLPVTVQGDTVRVGNATILLANIQAADGIVHIMDRPVVGTSLGAEDPSVLSPAPQPSMLAVARPPRTAAFPPLPEAGAPATSPKVPLPAPTPEGRVPPAAAMATPAAEQPLVIAPTAEAARPSPPPPAPSPEQRQPPLPSISVRVPSPVLPSPQPPAPSPAQASPAPKPSPTAPSSPPSPAVPSPPPPPAPTSPSPSPAPITISLLPSSTTDTGSTTGCACTSSGMSGTVQTGQTGCIRRAGESFVLPVQFCYVQDPACAAATPSSTFPGAAWRPCP
ncbi:hypothetical protein N2152v2_000326 [Parachlorella kessleri]